MNAAYKQEKKRNKRGRTHNVAPLITDPLFAAEEAPRPKKPKDHLFLSFPDETVLSSGGIKTELSYQLEPDVH